LKRMSGGSSMEEDITKARIWNIHITYYDGSGIGYNVSYDELMDAVATLTIPINPEKPLEIRITRARRFA